MYLWFSTIHFLSFISFQIFDLFFVFCSAASQPSCRRASEWTRPWSQNWELHFSRSELCVHRYSTHRFNVETLQCLQCFTLTDIFNDLLCFNFGYVNWFFCVLFLLTACICTGPAFAPYQPGQQWWPNECFAVLFWRISGLCQEGTSPCWHL